MEILSRLALSFAEVAGIKWIRRETRPVFKVLKAITFLAIGGLLVMISFALFFTP